MATRKTTAGTQPSIRNESALPDVRNTFPKSDAYAPRKWGKAGTRIMVEQALQGIHGFGTELWSLLGIEKRELARRRGEIVEMMRKVVADPERGFSTNRTAAVAVLGELGGVEVMPDIAAVLSSPFERPTTRAWAALALARAGRSRAVGTLQVALAEPNRVVRGRVIEALADTRSREAVAVLAEVARQEKDPVLANLAVDGVRALEQRLKLPPATVRRRAVKKSTGGTTKRPRG